MPSQSLSLASQTSAPAIWFCTQLIAPPWHWLVPALHTPAMPVTHAPPPPGLPSSTPVSQSLSSPSHTSGAAAPFDTQVSDAFWHCCVPGPHTPAAPVLQPAPPPALFSSAPLSQSLSRPSHVSALGKTSPSQPAGHAPPTHVCVPPTHWPMPCVPIGPP